MNDLDAQFNFKAKNRLQTLILAFSDDYQVKYCCGLPYFRNFRKEDQWLHSRRQVFGLQNKIRKALDSKLKNAWFRFKRDLYIPN